MWSLAVFANSKNKIQTMKKKSWTTRYFTNENDIAWEYTPWHQWTIMQDSINALRQTSFKLYSSEKCWTNLIWKKQRKQKKFNILWLLVSLCLFYLIISLLSSCHQGTKLDNSSCSSSIKVLKITSVLTHRASWPALYRRRFIQVWKLVC